MRAQLYESRPYDTRGTVRTRMCCVGAPCDAVCSFASCDVLWCGCRVASSHAMWYVVTDVVFFRLMLPPPCVRAQQYEMTRDENTHMALL